MVGLAAHVTAEWALRGKLESDRGYRLLACSNGTFSAHNFEEILTRYSPGTLEELPQVTVSWIPSSEAGKSYLAIAIHELSEDGQYDLDGRRIVFTRYFCAPYGRLAEAGISYQVMFDKFHEVGLGASGSSPITVDLEGHDPQVPLDSDLVFRVAALLLTGNPVCIIDADRAEMRERLQFIDGVMALLPYGLRSRMSASTWTSSTTQRHKFRLFFSNSPRVARLPDERDYVLSWAGARDRETIRYFTPDHRRVANRYLEWLNSRDQLPVASLATLTEQVTFARQDIERILTRVRKLPRRPRQLALPSGRQAAPDRRADVSEVADVPEVQTPREERGNGQPPANVAASADTVETLLVACAQALETAGNPGLNDIIKALNNKLDNAEVQRIDRRRRYWDVIIGNGLLRSHLVGFDLPLFETLLRVAFGHRAISYEVFCQIEDALGTPPHRALAEALDRMGVSEIHMQVILHELLADSRVIDGFRVGDLDVCELIHITASEELRSEHLRVILDVLIRILDNPSIQPRMADIRATLRHYGYLAPLLQRREPEDQQYQINTLRELLYHAVGRILDKGAAIDILSGADENSPTPGLLAAVSLLLSDPADASFVLREFMVGYVANARLETYTSHELLSLYAGDNQSLPGTLVIQRPEEGDEPSPRQQMGDHVADAAGKTQEQPRWRRSLSWRPQVHNRPVDGAKHPPDRAD